MKRTQKSDSASASGDPTTDQTSQEPTRAHLIAERAYQLYQMRGGGHGRDVDDWLAAEQEITGAGRRSGKATAARKAKRLSSEAEGPPRRSAP